MKRGRKKLTRKVKKKMQKQYNQECRRSFVNLTCSKCGQERHIRVNNKDDWEKVDRKGFVCVICRHKKRR